MGCNRDGPAALTFDRYHDEVVAALREIGDPAFGAAVARDRGSSLEHLGIRFPALRRRVEEGFSFYALPDDEVLSGWDRLWRSSSYGDVLFAALEYYAPRVRKQVSPALWPVVRRWPERVDNWCHCDGLGSLFSWLLASEPESVYPQLEEWSRTGDPWLRRLSLVSLVHYSGKNAVFFPLERVLPLVTACLADEREYVANAVGWVLRETGQVYPDEVGAYLEEHVATITASAFRRAVERRSPQERDALRALRAAAQTGHASRRAAAATSSSRRGRTP